MIDLRQIQQDFAMLSAKNGVKITYLDNAASTFTPNIVLDKMHEYYVNYRANVHRGVYGISEKATEEYENARKKIADFINVETEEIILTSGTTAALNLLAYVLCAEMKEGDEILLSEMEHHSNIVSWQQIANEKNLIVKYVKIKDYEIDFEDFGKKLNSRTKIVSVVYVSNVLGSVNPVEKIVLEAKKHKAVVILDAAQAAGHFKIDVKKIGCDFLAFSGHKMCGPTGVGALYGKKELLARMKPFLYGGDMIKSVSFKETDFNDLPWKFEAGTPNIAGVIGFGAAIDYLNEVGMENIEKYERELASYVIKRLSEINGLKIYGLGAVKNRKGVLSFNLNGMHAHDVASILDKEGVAIRAGHMCAMPLIREVIGVQSVCRASLAFYNTRDDVDKLINALDKAREKFK